MNVPISAKAGVLVALADGPGGGLEIIERITRRTDGLVKLYNNAVYPAVYALREEGLIEPWEEGGRAQAYRLTGEGRRVAAQHQQVFAALGLRR